jgi:hypothetical protein
MLFKERSVTFREFTMGETVRLSVIQEAVLEFLQDREDAVVVGAQAVNAYVDEPRMSQDVDILALDPSGLAELICQCLSDRFNIAVRILSVSSGRGLRIYQIRKPQNRHLVDVRGVATLPPNQRLERILVPTPCELIAQKIISMVARPKTAKGMTDIADLRRLILTFPDLKVEQGAVADSLTASGATPETMHAWRDFVGQEIEPEDDDAY